MLGSDQARIVGEVIFCGLLAEPFFHSATDSLMHREYVRALVGYLVGTVPVTIGLIVLGVVQIGPFTRAAISTWLHPLVGNPIWWLALWLLLLLWTGGPRLAERMKAAYLANQSGSHDKPAVESTAHAGQLASGTGSSDQLHDFASTFRRQYVFLCDVFADFAHLDNKQIVFNLRFVSYWTGYEVQDDINGHIFYAARKVESDQLERENLIGLPETPSLAPAQDLVLPNGGEYTLVLLQHVSDSVAADMKTALSDPTFQLEFFLTELVIPVVSPEGLRREDESLPLWHGIVCHQGLRCDRILFGEAVISNRSFGSTN